MSFFLGYGEATEKMRVDFKQVLDELTMESDQEVVMISANNTFIKFRDWIEKNLDD